MSISCSRSAAEDLEIPRRFTLNVAIINHLSMLQDLIPTLQRDVVDGNGCPVTVLSSSILYILTFTGSSCLMGFGLVVFFLFLFIIFTLTMVFRYSKDTASQ
jgi:hypothetical protein